MCAMLLGAATLMENVLVHKGAATLMEKVLVHRGLPGWNLKRSTETTPGKDREEARRTEQKETPRRQQGRRCEE